VRGVKTKKISHARFTPNKKKKPFVINGDEKKTKRAAANKGGGDKDIIKEKEKKLKNKGFSLRNKKWKDWETGKQRSRRKTTDRRPILQRGEGRGGKKGSKIMKANRNPEVGRETPLMHGKGHVRRPITRVPPVVLARAENEKRERKGAEASCYWGEGGARPPMWKA